MLAIYPCSGILVPVLLSISHLVHCDIRMCIYLRTQEVDENAAADLSRLQASIWCGGEACQHRYDGSVQVRCFRYPVRAHRSH